MAIDAKFTRTLPVPTATISSGFVFLLSAGWFTDADLGVAGSPIGGGANSIANGGVDMQIFSDTAATTRLPIEVVSFVTGGTPEAQVWVRTPSYTSGDTITVGRDDTQTVQPAVGAAFGRNATWVDLCAGYHGGSVTDITGNGNDLTLFNAPTLNSDNFLFNGTNQYATASITSVTPGLTLLTVATSSGPANNNRRISGLVDNSDANARVMISRLDGSTSRLNNHDGSTNLLSDITSAITNGVKIFFSTTEDSTTRTNYTDGLTATNSSTLDYTGISLDTVNIAARTSLGSPVANEYYDGSVYEALYVDRAVTSDYHDSWNSNQSDPDNFGTSSEWILVAVSGFQAAWAKNANTLINWYN